MALLLTPHPITDLELTKTQNTQTQNRHRGHEAATPKPLGCQPDRQQG